MDYIKARSLALEQEERNRNQGLHLNTCSRCSKQLTIMNQDQIVGIRGSYVQGYNNTCLCEDGSLLTDCRKIRRTPTGFLRK
jgi:hypothetical protein